MYWLRDRPVEQSASDSNTLFNIYTILMTIWPVIYIIALISGWLLYRYGKIPASLIIAIVTTMLPLVVAIGLLMPGKNL